MPMSFVIVFLPISALSAELDPLERRPFFLFSCLNYITLQIRFSSGRPTLHRLALMPSTASALALPISLWIPLACPNFPSPTEIRTWRWRTGRKIPRTVRMFENYVTLTFGIASSFSRGKCNSRGAGSLGQRQRLLATYSAIHQCSRLDDAVSLMTGGDRLKLCAICLRYPHGAEDKCPICRNPDMI